MPHFEGLTPDDTRRLLRGECPECHFNKRFQLGPRDERYQRIECSVCHTRFRIGSRTIDRIQDTGVKHAGNLIE